ncbi:ThiS family protein [Candidatus Methanoperedens nitroreducens]|uniref:ThiS family protein n=1 Tax=Candidatus Methanoperedens nitratireducens TaxID=1392998 RepID=A0A062V1S6_9EURY|nr:MoaD/ThiS family protein [Candidatus Methanoperedens nitroreducens]KCZ73041.1 ThiS family protein [Candidatus Methanoperedens nitroreducens]MDJ1423014.1 MoaD/ThiS family protein [Candidatus Methanoperedens sp.]
MKVKINYDYSQQALLGKEDEVEVAENTTLGELLAQIDARIIEIGEKKNIDVSGLYMLRNEELGCIVAINKKPPENLLKYKLQNGDEIDIVFGFCGG